MRTGTPKVPVSCAEGDKRSRAERIGSLVLNMGMFKLESEVQSWQDEVEPVGENT